MNVDVLTAAVGFVVFVFSIIIHENAHGYVANRFGDPTAKDLGRITLNPIPHIDMVGSLLLPLMALRWGVPFIGWAKPVPVDVARLRNPRVHHAYVAAAGPASNFALAFVGAFIWIAVGVASKHIPALAENGDRTLVFFDTLCRSLIRYNCVLAVFNLMPIPPLDGHWIVMRFLPPGVREGYASIGRFGFLILLVLLWTGLLWAIIGPPFRAVLAGYHALVTAAVNLL